MPKFLIIAGYKNSSGEPAVSQFEIEGAGNIAGAITHGLEEFWKKYFTQCTELTTFYVSSDYVLPKEEQDKMKG